MSPESSTSDSPPPSNWHLQSIDHVTQGFEVELVHGLDPGEVEARFASYGANEIEAASGRPWWRMFGAQFTDFMILVLIAAAVISGLVGEPEDAIAIVVIVVLNAIVGAVQEYRAERAVAALRRMAAPEAQVRRGGALVVVPADRVVPGDVVVLEAGSVVPADLRLAQAIELKLDEAALTGESQSVDKITDALSEADAPLGDRRNMAYKGTLVTSGRATGVVVATGMATEIGRIATLLGREELAKTPLQRRLAAFGQRLAIAILGVCAVVFTAGLLRGEPVILMFLTAVSLAVAAIPEALPAVVTVSLALGARKMSRRDALIRRLPAVETLGSVTYICSDKTGTLTQNKMRLEAAYWDGRWQAGPPAANSQEEQAMLFGEALALNSDARLDGPAPTGDPTEVALCLGAQLAGYAKPALERLHPRVGEVPFDAERKRMTTLHRYPGAVVAFVKGAPEAVLSRCTGNGAAPNSVPADIEALYREAESKAREGYRVLAFASRVFTTLPDDLSAETVECELEFLGMAALIDPPREEAEQAVALCKTAGITPVMITGDHPGTARAIAKRVGIVEGEDSVLTGRQIDELADSEFEEHIARVRVYARVSPEQKIKIVKALQRRREFVAMTGDGVNDAPALKRADIGVAMGLKGTDVAREAADMVLLDDNFATIVAAVREGRRIFDNIRKFIKYTMTSNAGEIWTLFLAPLVGLPIPLLPIHILWINLVTDGLPGLALAAEPEERGAIQRPPRPPNESIFAHGMWQHMIWVGLLIGGVSIAAQAWAYQSGSTHWQTIVFTVLTLSQLAHALAIRTEKASLFTVGIGSNLPLLGAVLLTLGLQMAVIYVPFLNPIFKTQPLTAQELVVCLAIPLIVFAAVEIEKTLVRRGLLYNA